ncbi:hypothetical protein F0L68_06400 [Solihabitans fulvus]|uniref:Antitoxin of type II TA system, VapB n=1 Tax=Solihabitans fulvus TaxID=1892852 RepID=A0A5B2XLH8_9PSEU|nr:hypothetical protein [Solihabitans fulvus]KAA2264718.1 hypothetical protein F0L68_06400 [Solihabitans fulvus]
MKHLVDLDEDALATARDHLGTKTIKDTVNAALQLASESDVERPEVNASLDVLASFDFDDRAAAWH